MSSAKAIGFPANSHRLLEQCLSRSQGYIVVFNSQLVLGANVWVLYLSPFSPLQNKICRRQCSATHIFSNENSWNKICFIGIYKCQVIMISVCMCKNVC